MKPAFNREAAAEIKRRVDVPVFLVGGIYEPAVMEELLASGAADYIALSRALIADPKFPNKIRDGRREASLCKHCNLCIATLATRPLRCYQNRRPKALTSGTRPPDRRLTAG